MELPIGHEIARRRKERKLTQQDIADFMNVSKASVSKWETGQSYPDITFLPLLSAYFNCSVDDLLVLDSQLSAKEIQQMYHHLKKSFDWQSSDEVLAQLQNWTKRYYACYPFILQLGTFYLNHWDLLPDPPILTIEVDAEAQKNTKMDYYLKEAGKLFHHVQVHSDDDSALKAKQYAAYCSLLRKRPDDVFAVIGHRTPTFLPTEILIAAAYQQKSQIQEANQVFQSAYYQYLIVMMSILTNYMQLLGPQKNQLKATYQRGIALIESCQLDQLHPIATLNFLASAMHVFAQIDQQELLADALSRYVSILEQNNTEYILKGDHYFNQIDEWIASFDLGEQLPRNYEEVKKQLIGILNQKHFKLGSRPLWIIVSCFISIIGPILYFALGKGDSQ